MPRKSKKSISNEVKKYLFGYDKDGKLNYDRYIRELKKPRKYINKRTIVIMIALLMLVAGVYEVAIGRTLTYYKKWESCGSRPVIEGTNYALSWPPKYYTTDTLVIFPMYGESVYYCVDDAVAKGFEHAGADYTLGVRAAMSVTIIVLISMSVGLIWLAVLYREMRLIAVIGVVFSVIIAYVAFIIAAMSSFGT